MNLQQRIFIWLKLRVLERFFNPFLQRLRNFGAVCCFNLMMASDENEVTAFIANILDYSKLRHLSSIVEDRFENS